MYETYPGKSHHKAFGKSSLPEGRGNGKTSYPSKGCCSQDDTKAMHLKYSRLNGQSAPGTDYAKGKVGHKQFPELSGLPS